VSILCTFPGKYGDLLWALPTIRALARRTGEAIDLQTSADMASICPLIAQQGYIGHAYSNPDWIRVHVDTQDRLPPDGSPTPPHRYDHIFHLGYRGWPQRPLPFETVNCLNEQWLATEHKPILESELDLGTPWITAPEIYTYHWAWVHGFSDDHFELKYGLVQLLEKQRLRFHPGPHLPPTVIGSNPRWETEGGFIGSSWEESAAILAHTSVFLGCNSGLHVLALALGKPVVMMEPSEARWNPIFFPFGPGGPEVTLVRGNDGKPTWDARHVADALQHVLWTVEERHT